MNFNSRLQCDDIRKTTKNIYAKEDKRKETIRNNN